MFLILQTTNASFQSTDKGRDYASLDAARSAAISATSQIAMQELDEGKPSVCVEAMFRDLDGVTVLRFALSGSVSDLTMVPAGT